MAGNMQNVEDNICNIENGKYGKYGKYGTETDQILFGIIVGGGEVQWYY